MTPTIAVRLGQVRLGQVTRFLQLRGFECGTNLSRFLPTHLTFEAQHSLLEYTNTHTHTPQCRSARVHKHTHTHQCRSAGLQTHLSVGLIEYTQKHPSVGLLEYTKKHLCVGLLEYTQTHLSVGLLDSLLAGVDANCDTDVEVRADADHRFDVAAVAVSVRLDALQDDAKGLRISSFINYYYQLV